MWRPSNSRLPIAAVVSENSVAFHSSASNSHYFLAYLVLFCTQAFFCKNLGKFTVLRFGKTPWQFERRRKCPYEVIAPWYLLCFSISILSRLLTNSRRTAFQLKFLALVEVNPCSQCEAIYRRMWEFQEQKFPSIFNYGFVSPCVNFHFEIILHFSVRLSTTASLE